MNLGEKSLYHQIHPAKLLTDWISTFPALYLFWTHDLILGLVIAVVPSIVASAVIIRFVDLTRIKESESGKYLETYMTGRMQSLRFLGLVVMVVGAWTRIVSPIILGTGMILFAWFRGLVLSRIQNLLLVFLPVFLMTLIVDVLLGLGGSFHFTIFDVALDLAAGIVLGILTLGFVARVQSGQLRIGTVIVIALVGVVLVLEVQGGEARQLVIGF